MAGPLDGLDLGAPAPADPKKTTAPATVSSGPLAGFDPSAPGPASKTTQPTTYDDASALGVAGDTAYRAANTGSLGLLDYGLAGLHKIERGTGYDPNATDLTTIQRQGDEWGANHPLLALGADVAGYGVGFGKLGLGAKAAKLIGKGVLSRMAGAGIESVGSTLASDEIKSQGQVGAGDLLKDALISGTVGTATGGIPVRGNLAGEATQTPGLQTATKQAFSPLKNAEFHPGDVGPAYDNAVSSISSGQRVKLDGDFKAKMNEISQEMADKFNKKQPVTADDVASYSQALKDKAGGGKLEQDVANDLNTALHAGVSNAKPLSGPYQTGAQASQAIKDATAAAEKSNASRNIDDWLTQAGKNAGKTSEDIAATLKQNPGFFQTPGLRSALQDAAVPPSVGSQLASVAAKDLAGGAIGAGADYLFGTHDLIGSLLAGMATAAGTHGANRMLSNPGGAALARELAAARRLNATGVPVSPEAYRGGIPVPGPMSVYGVDIRPNLRAAPGVGVSNFFNESQYQ